MDVIHGYEPAYFDEDLHDEERAEAKEAEKTESQEGAK